MALIVEDGTGLSTAEAYVSIADAETYLTARGITFGGTTSEKEQALRVATEWLDATYGGGYFGTKKTSAQALLWPRSGGIDLEGFTISSSIVPVALERATAEIAYRYQADTTILDADVAVGSDIVERSEELGPLKERTKYAGTKQTQKRFPKVSKLMASIALLGGRVVLG